MPALTTEAGARAIAAALLSRTRNDCVSCPWALTHDALVQTPQCRQRDMTTEAPRRTPVAAPQHRTSHTAQGDAAPHLAGAA